MARVLSVRCPDSHKELFNELFFLKKKRKTCSISPRGAESLAEDRKRMLPALGPPKPAFEHGPGIKQHFMRKFVMRTLGSLGLSSAREGGARGLGEPL